METREEIHNKQKELRDQLDILKKQVQDMDREENIAEANKYLGKFYIEVQKYDHTQKYIRIYHVYGIEKTGSCGLLTLAAHYNQDHKGYFGIEDSTHFWPEPDSNDDLRNEYKEITMQEFDRHYAEVINRIVSKYGRQLY